MKYRVTYEYTMVGTVEVEAKSATEAKAIHIEADSFGEYEQHHDHRVTKVKKIK